MTNEEKEIIKKGIVWHTSSKMPYGGQHAGMPPMRVTLTHPDFDFSVSCGEFRSQSRCREFLYTIFEIFLEERK